MIYALRDVEISCHGGPVVVERVLAALARRGAESVGWERLLERAVANRRLDRVQAEAWSLLPRALTELAARILLYQAQGALSRAVREGRDVLSTAPLGIALASPRRIVIAGRPNAGKSTLFNALLNDNRVIVSDVPGTTRDPVRETIAIDGVPFLLCDTAGVEEGRALDLLETLSVERTRREVETADLVLFLHDREPRPDEDRFLAQVKAPALRVVNKSDLGGPGISARTGAGIPDLRRRILAALGIIPRHEPGAPVVFTEKQRDLLAAGRGMDLL